MGTSLIELRGLRVLGRIGVTEAERQQEQPLELDLDVALDTIPAASSDHVDDTLDSGRLAEQVGSVVATSSFHLLETLAEELAATVLANPIVEEVTVVVRKLRPPVPVDLHTAGVRITRSRR
jgi:7,8-dihydroneopterin aldolase/epimerase/oxygenase